LTHLWPPRDLADADPAGHFVAGAQQADVDEFVGVKGGELAEETLAAASSRVTVWPTLRMKVNMCRRESSLRRLPESMALPTASADAA
jgi:hypothetical protein